MLFRSEVIIEIEHLGRPVGRIVYIGTIFVENAVSGDVHVLSLIHILFYVCEGQ